MRNRSFLRALFVAVMICSWLATTNHCALAAFAARPGASESCPMHSKPAQPKEDTGLVCCHVIPAHAAFAVVKVVAPDGQLLATGSLFPGAIVHDLGPREPVLLACDTGPPLLPSFAESVLQRSLRAHAPPSLG